MHRQDSKGKDLGLRALRTFERCGPEEIPRVTGSADFSAGFQFGSSLFEDDAHEGILGNAVRAVQYCDRVTEAFGRAYDGFFVSEGEKGLVELGNQRNPGLEQMVAVAGRLAVDLNQDVFSGGSSERGDREQTKNEKPFDNHLFLQAGAVLPNRWRE